MCVTIHSASGIHSVCNYEIHHNVILLTTAIPGNFDNKQLLPELVCDLNKRECRFHNCDLCPGVEKLGEHIKDIFTKAHIDDDMVSFKQWMVKDNFTNLSALQFLHEFVSEICHQFENLSVHNFISKAQASHLTKLK